MKLPVNYDEISREERRAVRFEYIKRQENKCAYCKESLSEKSPHEVAKKSVNWYRFPGGKNFLKYPIHLHHDHGTGLTIGAVHAYCNAVSFDYDESPL